MKDYVPATFEEIVSLARTYGLESVNRLVLIMKTSKSDKDAIAAAKMILNLGYGDLDAIAKTGGAATLEGLPKVERIALLESALAAEKGEANN